MHRHRDRPAIYKKWKLGRIRLCIWSNDINSEKNVKKIKNNTETQIDNT